MNQVPCIVCGELSHRFVFAGIGLQLQQCTGCELVSDRESLRNLLLNKDPGSENPPCQAGQKNSQISDIQAAEQFDYAALLRETSIRRGRIFLIAPDAKSRITESLEKAGYELFVHPGPLLPDAAGLKAAFDAVLLVQDLDMVASPDGLLRQAQKLLKPSGLFIGSIRTLDGANVSRLRGAAAAKRPVSQIAQRNYFNRSTLQLLLEKCGFNKIWLQPNNAAAVADSFSYVPYASGFVPAFNQRFAGKQEARLTITARKCQVKAGPKLSVIIPVYNEAGTCKQTIDLVLKKRIKGISAKELIIVESNSSDGTRDIVEQYLDHPEVTLVFEKAPAGKGRAVRRAFEYASGDIVIIQDGDSEYDVNDYDELIEPLLNYRREFVLGSRHQGSFKMRKFTDQRALAAVMNLGQVFFTKLMNTLYGQHMTDPFTMYKVFRRECLYGLNFECNRFDFDHELVIKLVRKGYKPLDVPVSYVSRSFSQGKKVTFVRDPLLWIKANFKYRFVSPYKINTNSVGIPDKLYEARLSQLNPNLQEATKAG